MKADLTPADVLKKYVGKSSTCAVMAFERDAAIGRSLAATAGFQFLQLDRYKGGGARDSDVVILLTPSADHLDRTCDRVKLARDSILYTQTVADLLTKGSAIVVTSARAITHASCAELAPISKADQEMLRILRRYLGEGRYLELGGVQLPLPSRGWEIESTDCLADRLTQAPGGEIFCHFDCKWSGRLQVQTLGKSNDFSDVEIRLDEGTVVAAWLENGSDRQRLTPWLGTRITEIGFGANSRVKVRPEPWAEKARGTIHIGLGPRMINDTAPPSIHFDVLLNFDRDNLNHCLEGANYGLPLF